MYICSPIEVNLAIKRAHGFALALSTMTMKSIILILLTAMATAVYGDQENKIALSKERSAVESHIANTKNQAVLAVNGLCCRSCAIGIGKKVVDLDFIDTEVLPNGVKVDRKNSLLIVSIKEGMKIDLPTLVKAINNAGYKPVRLYEQEPGSALKVTDIPNDL